MLRVYNRNAYVSVNGEDWYCLDSSLVMRDDARQSEEELIMDGFTFEQCKDFLWNMAGHPHGVYLENNMLGFGKKLLVCVHYCDKIQLYKNFNRISYKYVYTRAENVTLQELIQNFSADQCIQYLKERGISACPIVGGNE